MYAALDTSLFGDNADEDVVIPTKINDGKPELK